MKQDFSYTVGATSDLAKQLQNVVDSAEKSIDTSRMKNLQEVQKKVDDLKSRGLLKKQEYVSVSTSGFEKIYYSYKDKKALHTPTGSKITNKNP